jgi:translocation and assembly module TamB
VDQGLVSLGRTDPYHPQVLVNASSRAYGYDLKLVVHGPADQPVIEFSSTPGLTSEEIILMLTAGEIPKRELAFSTQKKAQTLALFVGKGLWSKLSSGQGGAERLTVKSGEDVSEQGKPTYSVEYKLAKGWSLVGEYDKYGALNAGVKWKVYSR